MNDSIEVGFALRSQRVDGYSLSPQHLLHSVRERIAHLVHPRLGHHVEYAISDAVNGGKMVRPRLLIAAAGKSGERETIIRVAAAMELVHAALLVHDDLIDGDSERRGRTTVARAAEVRAERADFSKEHCARVGLTAAVVSGDVLLTRGLGELTRLEAPVKIRNGMMDIMDRALSAAALGEFDDVWHARSDLEEDFILALLERKTADYSFRAPLEAGAVIAGRSTDVVRKLGSVGMRMGVLYQLRDDVLGTFGDETRTGKSVLSDLRTGAPTMLVHLASKSPKWRDIASLWGDPDSDLEALEQVRGVLIASGALDELRARMEREIVLLSADISALDIEGEVRDELEALLLSGVERYR